MDMLGWADRRVKALTIWDIAVLKVLLLLVGMIAGAYLAVFVRAHLWSLVISAGLLWAFMIYRMLCARPR